MITFPTGIILIHPMDKEADSESTLIRTYFTLERNPKVRIKLIINFLHSLILKITLYLTNSCHFEYAQFL